MPMLAEPNSTVLICYNIKMTDALICIRISRTKGDYVSPMVLKVRSDSIALLLMQNFKTLTIVIKICKHIKHVFYCSVQLLPKTAFRFDNYLPESGEKCP